MSNEPDAKIEIAEYKAPELSRLGSIGSLTAGGVGSMAENNGADTMLDRQMS